MSSFRWVFVGVFVGTAIVVAAIVINAQRPSIERGQPTAALATASGKCAECHRRETSAIVHEYEMSAHARAGTNCLDCHHPQPGQQGMDHNGFVIAQGGLTSRNCAPCHAAEYDQFSRSRHAGPSWAAVHGPEGFSPEQLALSERFNPGWIQRPANPLTGLEGAPAILGGCDACHQIGRPNPDGSFGSCTNCHARHAASVRLARLPRTCGQCHMGPDHSQIEIYSESKHGVIFEAQQARMNLDANPKQLTTTDMPVPTCSTCHLSGLEGMRVTHDPGERLSYFLFSEVSQRRPNADRAELEMQELCMKCHTKPYVQRFYKAAQAVVQATNEKVQGVSQELAELHKEGLLTPQPLDEPLEFAAFDLWHYFGRTTKHGAFMGGADFVQWHGNYELLRLKAEIDEKAKELRARRAGK